MHTLNNVSIHSSTKNHLFVDIIEIRDVANVLLYDVLSQSPFLLTTRLRRRSGANTAQNIIKFIFPYNKYTVTHATTLWGFLDCERSRYTRMPGKIGRLCAGNATVYYYVSLSRVIATD